MQRAARILTSLRLPEGCIRREKLIVKAWTPAVGKRIAARTRAIHFRQGTLLVEVADTVWEAQLRPLEGFIKQNLEKVLGQPWVERIEFRTCPLRRMPSSVAIESAGAVEDPAAQRRLPLAAADEADRIADPVLRRLYRESRKRQTA